MIDSKDYVPEEDQSKRNKVVVEIIILLLVLCFECLVFFLPFFHYLVVYMQRETLYIALCTDTCFCAQMSQVGSFETNNIQKTSVSCCFSFHSSTSPRWGSWYIQAIEESELSEFYDSATRFLSLLDVKKKSLRLCPSVSHSHRSPTTLADITGPHKSKCFAAFLLRGDHILMPAPCLCRPYFYANNPVEKHSHSSERFTHTHTHPPSAGRVERDYWRQYKAVNHLQPFQGEES